MSLLSSSVSTADAGVTRVEPSISFLLDNRQYVARPLDLAAPCVSPRIHFNPKHSLLSVPSLVTCVKVDKGQTIDVDALRTWRLDHIDQDDVFHPEFLTEVVFSGVESTDVRLTGDARDMLTVWGTRKVRFGPNLDIDDGSYAVVDGMLYTVWRVYSDSHLAFSQALWPTVVDKSLFSQVSAPGNGYRSHGVAVPSRAHTGNLAASQANPTSNGKPSPLQGMRSAIKDNFHVRGTKTSLGNRAYFETYPIQDSSAAVVTKILGAGAHLVGKPHLSSFAMMEHPTQSVDYQAPFNPRGDGYLIPGGSSSGSAATMAAYDWLDIAICTDTTGSSRIPAFQTGLFGFRPTKPAISGEGLVHAWEAMDTTAWIGRDLKIFPAILQAVSDPPARTVQAENASPTRILYLLDFEPQDSPEQVKAMEILLTAIDNSSGNTHQKTSIHDDWSNTAPVDEKDLRQYLRELTHHGWFYAAFHSFDSFREKYERVNGHKPFVTEVVRWYWELGSKVSHVEHNELMSRLAVFKDWFTKQYLSDKQTIIALHIDKVQPRYRDQYPGDINPNVPGLRSTFLSAILGCPELAIPIAELPYKSRITEKEERLPIVVSLIGNAGADMDLLQWSIKVLENDGRPTKVKTGNVMF
ncbi:amidase signature domain-containing protein [Stachybotrys elegans]|uniref:Amidase signature domain-containing protein n=1 Tax=Stachybotrys elegans TaxID=80388 RepID=A0A8K0WQE5_9HYPO|nr:amidase signature domain-containing protein [Stachybotrys elegans]